jgi:hypothetical protein
MNKFLIPLGLAASLFCAPATWAHFGVSQPDLPNCTAGHVRQIGVGAQAKMASSSAGTVPLSVAVGLILPKGWQSRISAPLASAPVHWDANDTWVEALTSAGEGCYTVDWTRHVLEGTMNPHAALKTAAATATRGRTVRAKVDGKSKHKKQVTVNHKWCLNEGDLLPQLGAWAKRGDVRLEVNADGKFTVHKGHCFWANNLDSALNQAFNWLAKYQNILLEAKREKLSSGQYIAVNVSNARQWKITPQPLRALIEGWAKTSGWQIVWQAPKALKVQTSAVLHGSFTNAIHDLVSGLNRAGINIVVDVYPANKTLVVKGGK